MDWSPLVARDATVRVSGGPVVILDRDGTLIVDRHYLADPDGVVFERDAVAGLQRLARVGATFVVVTNQSGVGYGRFDRAAVDAINARIAELLADEGTAIAGWYVCPHIADAGCDCRKPRPELLLRAAAELGFDPASTFVIGDKLSDVGLAHAVGGTGLLVRTGKGKDAADATRIMGVPVVDTLVEAAEWIIGRMGV